MNNYELITTNSSNFTTIHRQLIKKYHPDINGDTAYNRGIIKTVNKLYSENKIEELTFLGKSLL